MPLNSLDERGDWKSSILDDTAVLELENSCTRSKVHLAPHPVSSSTGQQQEPTEEHKNRMSILSAFPGIWKMLKKSSLQFINFFR